MSQYYDSVLQSTKKVLLCTAPVVFLGTTKYYKVLLHTTLYYKVV